MNETTLRTKTGLMVRLIGVLGSAAQQRELYLDIQTQTTLAEVITLLLKKVNNPQFESYLVEAGTGDPRPNVIILLNEQDCNLFEGLKTNVHAGTVVTIIPVAHGG